MALKSTQVSITGLATAVSALTGFANNSTAADPVAVLITNTDTTNFLYVGGPGVTDATGTPIYPQTQLPLLIYSNDIPFLYSPNTLTVSIMCSRQ